MIKNKEKFARIAATATAVTICILSLALSVVIIVTAQRMQQHARAIYEHPYTTSNTAREMRSRLLDMKQFVAPIVSNSSYDEESLFELLDARYARQYEAIDKMRRHYLGPPADLDDIERAMNDLRAAQADAVRAMSDVNDSDAVFAYFGEHVYPYYDAVSEQIDVVVAFAENKIHELERQSTTAATFTIVSAVVFPLVIIAFAVYAVRLERKRQRNDVTYRERVFDMMSATLDVVFIVKNLLTGKQEYVSPDSGRLLGIEADAHDELAALREKLTDGDETKLDELVQAGLSRKRMKRELRFSRAADEQIRWLSAEAYPIVSESYADRFILTLADVTESVNSRQALAEALTVAQNANNAKKDFLSRMSHEIRTPMNAVIGMTTIAAAYIDDKKRVEDCLAKISFSSRHLLSLINDVLDMSKIEDNKLTVAHEPFAFKHLIESVTAIVYAQSEAKGVTFDERLIDCDEETFVGDSMRVNQILLNLLSNAVKFTPPGGSVRLDIRQLKTSGDGVRLRFTVSDTGIGMSEAFLQRLYLPFEQADASTAQKYGGTGLGMPITKNLVVLLGGTIDVKSEPDKGTTFTVELPFDLTPERERGPRSRELGALDVLVVDDDKDVCVHADLVLQKLGVRSQWVLSGGEAVKLVVSAHETGEDFDVCIIDWKMPDMDGIETTRRIRKAVGDQTPIIILSAYDWSEIEREAREAGANAFISKPMFASTLYNTLLSVTDRGGSKRTAEPLPETYDFSGKKVLLAEDNVLNMEIAAEILKMTGVKIVCAVNGREAADTFLSSAPNEYDLILMDIQMPVMDGYEATKVIRAARRPDAGTVPIYAMTANAFNEDIAAARANGMNGHIAKPIDVDKFYALMNEVLGGKAE